MTIEVSYELRSFLNPISHFKFMYYGTSSINDMIGGNPQEIPTEYNPKYVILNQLNAFISYLLEDSDNIMKRYQELMKFKSANYPNYTQYDYSKSHEDNYNILLLTKFKTSYTDALQYENKWVNAFINGKSHTDDYTIIVNYNTVPECFIDFGNYIKVYNKCKKDGTIQHYFNDLYTIYGSYIKPN